jgi:hypothetical protein
MRRILILVASWSIASAAFGAWTELGPRYPGRVSAIVATDVDHLWVATPGGGVWKSSNGGTTFAWAGNYGLGDFTAVHLALDRNDPSRMYLRTWSGFLVSTDGGARWTRTLYSLPQGDTPYPYPSFFCGSWPACPPFAATSEDPGPYAQMVLSPSQSVILTALPCQGLQYSTDRGAHFAQLWPFTSSSPLQRNPDNCVSAIAVDEATRQVWITTMSDMPHIYRSHQAWTASGPPPGLTWDLIAGGLPVAGHSAVALAWGGSANRLMTLINEGDTYQAYLFNGTAWSPKPWNNPGCAFRDARALVWGGGNDFFAGGVTFASTSNAGDTWTCPSLGQQYVDIRAIYASPSARSVWIGGDQNQLGNYRLLTRYAWTPGTTPAAPVGITGEGIASWQAYTIGQGYATGRLLVGAQDIAAACSSDLGARFQLTPTEEAEAIAWPRGAGGDTVYLFGTKGTLQKSINAASAASCAAMTFSDVTPPASFRRSQAFDGPHMLAVHPGDPNKVFLLSGGMVVYSTAGGSPSSWASSALPLTAAGGRPVGLTAIFVDEDGVLYVGTQDRGVYTCGDRTHFCDGTPGAGTWTPFALNPGSGVTPPAFVTAIAESNPPPAPRNFWIATSQGVYRRLAGSTTWTAVDAAPLYPYSDVVVDPTCRTRIYTAIGWLGKVSRTRGGIHASTDNGAHWTSLTSGFPLHNVPITQVLVDAAHPERLFVATYGRGAWAYQWSPLPACAP